MIAILKSLKVIRVIGQGSVYKLIDFDYVNFSTIWNIQGPGYWKDDYTDVVGDCNI